MSRTPAWKWLTRFTRRSSAAPARRCLPAVEQLDDRILPSTTAAPAAVTAFLKFESSFLANEATILANESAVIQQLGSQLPSSVANIFIKIDNDFIKIDADLGGSAAAGSTGVPGTVGGIDGVLLRVYNRQSASNDGLQAQKEASEAAADLTNIPNSGTGTPSVTTAASGGSSGPGGSGPPDAVINAYLQIKGIEDDTVAAANDFESKVQGISANFIKLDPADLKDPVAALQADLATLGADATLPPPPAAVEAFIKFEGEFLKFESSFIKQEMDYIKAFGTQVPGEAAYFLKIDNDLLALDNDITSVGDALLGIGSQASGAGGAVAYRRVLLQQGRLLDADGIVEGQVQAAEALLPQGTSAGSAQLAAASSHIFLKFDGIKGESEKGVADLAHHFSKIEAAFIAVDPADLTGPVNNFANDLNSLVADTGGQTTGGGTTT